MRLTGLLCLSAVVTAGCAQVDSSGVNQIGPDTYAVSVYARRIQGGIIGAEGIALEEAGSHCRRLGREILVVTSDTSTGAYKANFRCLLVGDPDLHRPPVLVPPDRTLE